MTAQSDAGLVSLADVRDAAERIRGVALRTPLLAFGPIDDRVGAARVWLKPENLQPIGAFKIRGAYNALATLTEPERKAGVVTHSSGNHAQGVARAARLLGIRAVIVMPDDAPAIKVNGVRADGAEIDVVGTDNEERMARADQLASERGLLLIPSYDDARIVAGQGTVGLEIVEQLVEMGRAGRPLTVVVPIGGGGLSAGVCVAVKGLRPDAVVVGVEPELAADAAESMAQDRIVRWGSDLTGRTIADGVRTGAHRCHSLRPPPPATGPRHHGQRGRHQAGHAGRGDLRPDRGRAVRGVVDRSVVPAAGGCARRRGHRHGGKRRQRRPGGVPSDAGRGRRRVLTPMATARKRCVDAPSGAPCDLSVHPRIGNATIIAAMPERLVPFSLLDAARVVARGGTFESKLDALAAQARTAADGARVAVLLHDADAGVLLSLDGEIVLPTAGAAAEIQAAITDREPVIAAGVPKGLDAALAGARSCLVSPLVIEDEEGAFVEGLLFVGWETVKAPVDAAPDGILALSDLAAVTVRQARLRNSAWEQSDHADRLLHTDRLTGLANRVTFERMLELEIARATRQGTPLAVAVLDVDGLSDISQASGARVADEVLRHVASAIADRVRLLDTVARFGEDEFVVIAPGDAGGIVALRLRDAIAELPPIGETVISVSAAVVHHPADGATGSELVAASEVALAQAKARGPGSIFGVQEATA